MKKRILYSAQIVLLALFILSLLATVFQLSGKSNPLARFDHIVPPPYNNIEAFDPSLSRLNSLKKLEQYCDSIYSEAVFSNSHVEFEKTYTDIVSSAVRNRFYHGYSYYGYSDNYVGKLASKITMPGLSALVIPNEILEYPYAACSQQSIVMMEVLKYKGISTRKVSFMGKTFGGHFAFEVLYDGAWHFNDPNMEPDKQVLNSYGRPGIAFLARNPEILVKAYKQYTRAKVLDILPNYSIGPVNTYPAPRAKVFQKATKFLSYTTWLFFLVTFLFIRRKYLRLSRKANAKNNLVPVPLSNPEVTPIYYPDYSAHGS